MGDEAQTDRVVQALNALTLAILSVRREMAAGPLDPTREHFLRDEESWSKAMEVSARELLEFGNTETPAAPASKPKWGQPDQRAPSVVGFSPAKDAVG